MIRVEPSSPRGPEKMDRGTKHVSSNTSRASQNILVPDRGQEVPQTILFLV